MLRLFKIAIFFIGVVSFAQSKVGVADIDFVISQLPEMENVRSQMEEYANKLDADFNKKLVEYNTVRDSFEEEKENLDEEAMRTRLEELIEMEQDIQKFQQNGQKLMELKQQEYLQPLYQKVGVALNQVAERENFTLVQEIGQDVIYLDANYNLTLPILKELGIEISEEVLEEQ